MLELIDEGVMFLNAAQPEELALGAGEWGHTD